MDLLWYFSPPKKISFLLASKVSIDRVGRVTQRWRRGQIAPGFEDQGGLIASNALRPMGTT